MSIKPNIPANTGRLLTERPSIKPCFLSIHPKAPILEDDSDLSPGFSEKEMKSSNMPPSYFKYYKDTASGNIAMNATTDKPKKKATPIKNKISYWQWVHLMSLKSDPLTNRLVSKLLFIKKHCDRNQKKKLKVFLQRFF